MLDQLEAEFPEHVPRSADAPKALEGIRVVDFSHFIAGPFATMILADMGADVIKIEAPERGDDLRRYPPLHPDLKHGAPFLWNNRNKRSVAIDLKSPEGLQIVRELIATADVVVENFSTGVMQRLGIDYDNCRKLRPEIVYCSVSAYGREGAFADRLGFDPIAQVESGFVSMNGYADREGVRALSPVMDISTAMMACNAILGALVARERSGKGQAIEVSLFDNAVLMTGYATLQHLFTGVDTQRHGNTSPDTCPSGVFQAQDGAFYINCGNDKIFQRLMSQVIDRADLASAEIYATGPDRIRRRDDLFAGPRRGLRATALVLLAAADAGRGRTVRAGAHRWRGDSFARSSGAPTCHPNPSSDGGLGAQCQAPHPLLAHPRRRSRRGSHGWPTHPRSHPRDTWLR